MGLSQSIFSDYVSLVGLVVLVVLNLTSFSGLMRLSRTVLFLRILVFVSILLALLNPYWLKSQSSARYAVLVDVSDSFDEGVAEQLLKRVGTLIGSEGNSKNVVLPFAGKAASAFQNSTMDISFRSLKDRWSELNIGATNLSGALEALGQSGVSNALLVSDGFENEGSAFSYLSKNTEQPFRLFPLVPKDLDKKSEGFSITNLSGPLLVSAGKSADLRVTISNETSEKKEGRLRVLEGDEVIFDEKLSVSPSSDRVVRTQSSAKIKGIVPISAELVWGDSNDVVSSETIFVSSKSERKILTISGSQSDQRFLLPLLKNLGLSVEAKLAGDLGNLDEDMSKSALVILNNVPARVFDRNFYDELARLVAKGTSLIMIGGQQSFGLGGYLNTRMEELLPVKMLPPQTIKKSLNAAVVLVLDKSRSMADSAKMDYAKEAAREVIRNLKDDDYVGVIGFDAAPFVVVKLDLLARIRSNALERVGRLFPAGRTNLLPAMDEARRSLLQVRAGRKHMIVLTDGKIPDAGAYYIDLVNQMRLLGISVSTVMLGGEADVAMLEQMAKAGGGRFYQTLDARNLPRIFLQDVKVSTGEKTLKENQEYLVMEGPDGIRTMPLESFPTLKGYVETKSKPGAKTELLLRGRDENAPLYAHWNYKLGKVAAYTSDVNGIWSNNWIKWNNFHTFWSSVFGSLLEGGAQDKDEFDNFDLSHEVKNGQLMLDVSVFSEDIGDNLVIDLRTPSGQNETLELKKLVAGKFHSSTARLEAGKYEVRVRAGERRFVPVAFNVSGSLFKEEKGRGIDVAYLEKLAEMTDGKLNPSREELARLGEVQKVKVSLQNLLLALALLFFGIEVVLRRRV